MSDSPARDLFRELVPELSGVSDGDVDKAIATAVRRLDGASSWSESDRVDAVVLYAGHLVASRGYAGGGPSAAAGFGAVVGQSDGNTSRTYAAPPTSTSSSRAWFATTRPGREYLALLDVQGFGARGVRAIP